MNVAPTHSEVDAIFERSRYDADIDFGRDLKPPLEDEEASLLERFRQGAS